MRFSDLVALALSNLFRRKFRTIMTIMGVIIGTASIVSMLSLGYGLQRSTLSNFSDKKSLREVKIQSESSWNPSGKQNFDNVLTDEVVEKLKKEPEVKLAIPVYSVNVQLNLGKWQSGGSLIGLDKEALDYYDFVFDTGEMPKEGDSSKVQMLMGVAGKSNFFSPDSFKSFEESEEAKDDLTTKLFRVSFYNDSLMSQTNQATQELLANSSNKKLPGIITGIVGQKKYTEEEKSGYQIYSDPYANNFFMYKDDLIKILNKYYKGYAIPNQKANRNGKPSGGIWYSYILLVTDGPEDTKTLYDRLQKENKYIISSQIDFVNSSQEFVRNIQLVLGAIGGISLLVAAIGIANTMMMSIYERTKEIGIFKVLGCDLSKIRNLIIFESAGIGFIGGILGVIVSYGVSIIINQTTGGGNMFFGGNGGSEISYIPPLLALLSIIFAGFIGTLSGLLPAIRAMKLSPLKAIRNE